MKQDKKKISRQAIWLKTPKGRAYQKTPKYKAYKKAYEKTPKRKAYQKVYYLRVTKIKREDCKKP